MNRKRHIIPIVKDANLKFKRTLLELRERHHFTQEDVSVGLGVNKKTYARWESMNNNQAITIDQAALIYEFYGLRQGYSELMTFLEPDHKKEITNRVLATCRLLDGIISGEETLANITKLAIEIRNKYESTFNLLSEEKKKDEAKTPAQKLKNASCLRQRM